MSTPALRAGRDDSPAFSPFMMPLAATNVWNPFLTGAGMWNSQVHEGFAIFALEWQNFLGRRFKQDMALVQQLAAPKSPDQFWTAHVEFWQKAIDDYAREYATLMKLASGVANKSLAVTQTTLGEAVKDGPEIDKAA